MAVHGDTAEAMERQKKDRRLLWLFAISFSTIFAIEIAITISLDLDEFEVIPSIFLATIASLLIAGILAWERYGKKGIISTKTVLKRFALLAAVFAVPATAPLSYIVATEPPVTATSLLIGSTAIYLSMILTIFLIFLVFTVLGFGIVGLVTIYQRRHTGMVLLKVREITANTVESQRMPKGRSGLEYAMYRWLFNIPPSLDTGTLKIDPVHPRGTFPWKVFWSSLMWMIFFSLVLAVYVSLNPFLLDISDFESLFSVSSNLALVVPVFILPWFIYVRLNARISGPAQDFKLLDGIKSRMVGTLVAFGTLIVFIRFALRDIDAFMILGNFAIYIVFFILAAFLTAFVYFNYFEDELAAVASRDYEELKLKPA